MRQHQRFLIILCLALLGLTAPAPVASQTGFALTNLRVSALTSGFASGESMVVEIRDPVTGDSLTLTFDANTTVHTNLALQTSGQAGAVHMLEARSTTHLFKSNATSAPVGDFWAPVSVTLASFPTPSITLWPTPTDGTFSEYPKIGGDRDGDGLLNGLEAEIVWMYQFASDGTHVPKHSTQSPTLISTWVDADSDNDSLSDADELPVSMGGLLVEHDFDADNDGVMNMWDASDDTDGMAPVTEVAIGTDPYLADTDGDGLTDSQEHWIFHTNPLAADTDGDGVSDATEVINGSDPLVANSVVAACTIIQPSAAFTPQLTSHVPSATWRLYSASFLRQPDQAGFDYWRSVRAGGTSLEGIADQFAASVEFSNRYGTLGNYEFVEQIYLNVFCRQPDQAGHDYWTARLNEGMSRGAVMVQFSESIESLQLTGTSYSYLG